MQAMLIEVAHYQATREEESEHTFPTVFRGKKFLLIQQDKFIGVGAEQRNCSPPEGIGAVDWAVLFSEKLRCAFGIGEQLQRVANERPTVGARNMGERTEGRVVDGDMRNNLQWSDQE